MVSLSPTGAFIMSQGPGVLRPRLTEAGNNTAAPLHAHCLLFLTALSPGRPSAPASLWDSISSHKQREGNTQLGSHYILPLVWALDPVTISQLGFLPLARSTRNFIVLISGNASHQHTYKFPGCQSLGVGPFAKQLHDSKIPATLVNPRSASSPASYAVSGRWEPAIT
jgi:hypothetical protein